MSVITSSQPHRVTHARSGVASTQAKIASQEARMEILPAEMAVPGSLPARVGELGLTHHMLSSVQLPGHHFLRPTFVELNVVRRFLRKGADPQRLHRGQSRFDAPSDRQPSQIMNISPSFTSTGMSTCCSCPLPKSAARWRAT